MKFRNNWQIYSASLSWLVLFSSVLKTAKVVPDGFDSGLTTINCGVPQGSVLGPILFLLYINDLKQAIKFCKVYHFADDLLCLSNSKNWTN